MRNGRLVPPDRCGDLAYGHVFLVAQAQQLALAGCQLFFPREAQVALEAHKVALVVSGVRGEPGGQIAVDLIVAYFIRCTFHYGNIPFRNSGASAPQAHATGAEAAAAPGSAA